MIQLSQMPNTDDLPKFNFVTPRMFRYAYKTIHESAMSEQGLLVVSNDASRFISALIFCDPTVGDKEEEIFERLGMTQTDIDHLEYLPERELRNRSKIYMDAVINDHITFVIEKPEARHRFAPLRSIGVLTWFDNQIGLNQNPFLKVEDLLRRFLDYHPSLPRKQLSVASK